MKAPLFVDQRRPTASGIAVLDENLRLICSNTLPSNVASFTAKQMLLRLNRQIQRAVGKWQAQNHKCAEMVYCIESDWFVRVFPLVGRNEENKPFRAIGVSWESLRVRASDR